MRITDISYVEPTKTELKIIGSCFKKFLEDNDIDDSGWSQPEMDFQFDTFKTGWMLCQEYIK